MDSLCDSYRSECPDAEVPPKRLKVYMHGENCIRVGLSEWPKIALECGSCSGIRVARMCSTVVGLGEQGKRLAAY